jgi:hypothetical protein
MDGWMAYAIVVGRRRVRRGGGLELYNGMIPLYTANVFRRIFAFCVRCLRPSERILLRGFVETNAKTNTAFSPPPLPNG